MRKVVPVSESKYATPEELLNFELVVRACELINGLVMLVGKKKEGPAEIGRASCRERV